MGNAPAKHSQKHKTAINLNNSSPDVQIQAFFRDNERFADLFNSCLFKGEQVVRSEQLRELDTNVSASILSEKFQATLKRTRDVVKFSGDGTCYRILGMEHQQHIHYAMPLRTMIYDSLSYLRQAEEISRRNHREKAWGDRDEFLSGLKKDDRLIPCYTAVLYWGEKEWDGPRTLADMMDFGSPGKPLYFQSYAPACLVCANGLTEYPFQNRDVSQLFQLIHKLYQSGRRNMPETFKNVSLETAYTAAVITGTKARLQKTFKNAAEQGKEWIDMWEVLKKELEEERAEGQIEMAEEMLKDGMNPEKVRRYAAKLSDQQWNKLLEQFQVPI